MKQLIFISLFFLTAPLSASAANTVTVDEPTVVCGAQDVFVSGSAEADVPEEVGLRVYLNNDIIDEFSVEDPWASVFEDVPVGEHRVGIEMYPLAGGTALSIDVKIFEIEECPPGEEPPVVEPPQSEIASSGGGGGGPSYRERACKMHNICTREEYKIWKLQLQIKRLLEELLELRMKEYGLLNP